MRRAIVSLGNLIIVISLLIPGTGLAVSATDEYAEQTDFEPVTVTADEPGLLDQYIPLDESPEDLDEAHSNTSDDTDVPLPIEENMTVEPTSTEESTSDVTVVAPEEPASTEESTATIEPGEQSPNAPEEETPLPVETQEAPLQDSAETPLSDTATETPAVSPDAIEVVEPTEVWIDPTVEDATATVVATEPAPAVEISGTPDTLLSHSANAFNPRMKLSEISGQAGMQITVEGTGFPPDKSGNLTIHQVDHAEPVQPDSPVLSDSFGEFSVPITIPTNAMPGDKFDVTVAIEQYAQTAVFTVFNPQGVELYVEPNSGYPGSVVNLSGVGFEPDGWVTILWNDNDLGEQLGYVPADRDGSFRSEITIPSDIPRGAYTIYAMDQSMRQASAEFSVVLDVTIKVSPTTGMPGERISVNGTGFLPGERVNIRWGSADGHILGYKNANANGTFSGPMLVPKDAAAGNWSIYLEQGGSGSVAAPFTVIAPPAPTISLSPTSGISGARITVIGTNFTPKERVYIHWGSATGPILGYKDANTNGAISGAILVPANAPGGSTQVFLESNSLVASAAFNVIPPTASVSPTSGLPGARLSVSGTNFTPDERVNIRWGSANGKILGYKNATSTGTFSGVMLVPADAAAGNSRIYLQSASGTASASFTVVAPPAPTATVSPASGRQGDRLTVSGTNFASGERVNIRWGSSSGPILGYKTANSNGTISGAILVPTNASAGSTRIYLQSASGTASVTFTVTTPPVPTISVSPTSGLPGARLSVSGTNFRPGERVNIRWGNASGNVLGYVNARSDGTVSGAILVPANASAGSTRIYLQSASATTYVAFSVQPKPRANVSLSYNWGTYGDVVGIQGWNFQPGETVSITFPGNSLVGRVAVRSDGTFSGRISVPKNAAVGYNTITSRGGSSGSAAGIRFEVFEYLITDVSVTSRALPGAVVQFSGSGFRPGEVIWLGINGSDTGLFTLSSSTGAISGQFTVPPTAATGNHVIQFANSDFTYYGQADLKVIAWETPQLSITSSAKPGGIVYFSGGGFGPGETVRIYKRYTNEYIGSTVTDATGSYLGYGTAPDYLGNIEVVAQGNRTARMAVSSVYLNWGIYVVSSRYDDHPVEFDASSPIQE